MAERLLDSQYSVTCVGAIGNFPYYTYMHPTQQNILDSLRQQKSRHFNELLWDVAETSDNLTYHLRQLQKDGLVESPAKGEYMLAEKGLVYLNNNLELNHDLFPTVSCMLELHGANSAVLLMRKLKQPYLGSLHLPTFGVTSMQTLQEQIDDFLDRYHIVANGLEFKGLHRERVRGNAEHMVFDKFFVVYSGTFTAFEHKVEDREFVAMALSELADNSQLLMASKVVLSLGSGPGFTETT